MTLSQILTRGKPQQGHVSSDDESKTSSSMLRRSKSFLNKLSSLKHLSSKKTTTTHKLTSSLSLPTFSEIVKQDSIAKKSNTNTVYANDILSPYLDAIDEAGELGELQNGSQLGPSETLKDMIYENLETNFEVDSLTQETILATPTKNSTRDILLHQSAPKRLLDYPNDTIFNDIDEISFNDNFISRSTSIHDGSINQNFMEVSSLKDIDFQIFQQYPRSTNVVVLEEQKKDISDMSDIPKPTLQPAVEIHRESLSESEREAPQIQHKNVQRSFERFEEKEMDAVSDRGKLEKLGADELAGRINSDENVYRQELMSLVEEHRVLLRKQSQEINHLKELLFQERKFNNYLASSSSLPGSPASSNSVGLRKIRTKFLPLEISVDKQQLKPFNLLPPVSIGNTDNPKSPKPVSEHQPSQTSPNQDTRERDPFPNIMKIRTSIARNSENSHNKLKSASSSVYFSALDMEMDEIKIYMSSAFHPLSVHEAETRQHSASSSLASVMSSSHQSAADSSASCRKMDTSVNDDIGANSVSTYTIHSNSTTPESLNSQSVVCSQEVFTNVLPEVLS
ncbi:nuclear localization sequence binding protein [Scheffersomyces xylosifermentans]|uniref:nuclear localization sequence binding protein n=1 Tax=Scheffersomyces xylosifermentans TaxID=1304137 RepID=UPI00315CEFC5